MNKTTEDLERKSLSERIAELEKENQELKLKIQANALSASEDDDIYFQFINKLNDFFWILDEHGCILFVNEYVVKRLHFSREELYQMNVIAVHPPERQQEALHIVTEMIAGRVDCCPIPIMTKEGVAVPVETRIVKGRWNNQEVIFGISKDISDLKLSEEKFSKAFDLNSNVVAISEMESGLYLDVNRKFLEMFNYAKEDVVGKTSIDIHLFDRDTRQRALSEFRKNDKLENFRVEVPYMGEMKHGLFSASKFYIQDKACLISMMQDITEIVETQNALSLSEERWKFALEGAKDGVWDWNLLTNQVYFSPQWKSMLGFDDPEINNNIDEWYQRVHPDDLQSCLNEIQKHLKEEVPVYSKIYRLKCKDDGYKWILDRGKVFERDKLGNPVRMIGTHTDLTDRIELEQKLMQLNADKDRFLQILAHDLRSPFTSLLGFTELLLENFRKYDEEKIEHHLTLIKQTLTKTFRLLEELLLWAKSQAGRLQFKPEQIDLDTILRDITLELEGQAEKKGIQLWIAPTEKHQVQADYYMLRTILRNLLTNAIKFSYSNEMIIINTEKVAEEVTISISDKGVGMSQAVIEKLWKITEHYTTSGTSGETGSGLGLLLCNEFVLKHNGRIWVESEVGKGSTFTFTMPLYNDSSNVKN